MKKIFVFIIFNISVILFWDAKAQDNITIDDAKTFIKKYVEAYPIPTATYSNDPGTVYDFGATNWFNWSEDVDGNFIYSVMFGGGAIISYYSLDDAGVSSGISIKDIQSITVKNNPIINQIEIHLELKKDKYVVLYYIGYAPTGITFPDKNKTEMSEIIIYMDSSSLAENYPNRIKKAFEFLIEKYGGNLYKDKF